MLINICYSLEPIEGGCRIKFFPGEVGEDLQFPQYEDKNFLIEKESVNNAIDYLMRINANVKEIDLTNKEILLSKQIIDEKDSKEFYARRFNYEQLITPFFSKKSFPSEFKLKNYQVEGIKWLQEAEGRLLADDMGLGKTAQSILAAENLFKNNLIKTILVICPRSLIYNWQREIGIWAPSMTSIVLSGSSKSEEIWRSIHLRTHFMICNYDQVRDTPKILQKFPPDLIIADEAHKLRKSTSKINKSISSIKSKRFWALTGTPIEKDTNDLATLMMLLNRDKYNSSFKKSRPTIIRAAARSSLLRRLKKDVLKKELSEASHQTILLPLTEGQNKEYLNIKRKMALDKKNSTLSYFNEMMAVCSEYKGQSSKLEFIINDLLEKVLDREEKLVVFSYTISPLRSLKKKLDQKYGKVFSELFIGELSSIVREKVLKQFKGNTETPVLLCSGKVAGEGLNLTEANNVVFINEWWNPSSNRQAQDRVLRIGQKKGVSIFHLRSKWTVEENLDIILDSKNNINLEVVEALVREEKV